MTNDEKNTQNKPKDSPNKEEKTKMDRELGQTFPASDPPSHSRAGHKRTEEEDD
jgi:hypothetical protein